MLAPQIGHQAKDAPLFRRPEEFSRFVIPGPSSRTTDPLAFRYQPFAPAQFILSSLAFQILSLQVGVKPGVLQGNRGLRSEQLQYCDPLRRESARSQIVLEIESADELRLFDDRQTEDRSGALLPHV
jgi:hypothetical protein